MNTSDVRNMQKGQWIFWASVIPVTLLVVVASLFGAGVLTLADLRSGLRNGYEEVYSRLPDDEEIHSFEHDRHQPRIRGRDDDYKRDYSYARY